MNARAISGWTALIAGALLAIGVVAAAFRAPSTATVPSMMGPGMMTAAHMSGGMMSRGHMGPGMMGFGNTGPASTPIPGAREVRVEAANFSFTPSEIHVPKGTDVNLIFTNPAATGVTHDLTVPALGVHIAANPGGTTTIGLRGLVAGRYEAYCSVPGHADLGMRATVVVE